MIDVVTEPTLHSLRSYDALPACHGFIATPLRLRCDPTAQVLTLHTFQSRQAYEVLVCERVLVGDATAINSANIRTYESGRALLAVPSLVRIAEALEVDPGDLLEGVTSEMLAPRSTRTLRE